MLPPNQLGISEIKEVITFSKDISLSILNNLHTRNAVNILMFITLILCILYIIT